MRPLIDNLPLTIIAAIAALFLALGALGWLVAPRGRFCPGFSRSRRALWPHRWFILKPCGYDLRDLPRPCTCPECGRWTAGMGHRPGALRLGRIGLVLAVAGVPLAMSDYMRKGQWARDLPPLAAISIERVLGTEAPDAVRRANRSLPQRGSLSPAELALFARSLVIDLGDDATDNNAGRAFELLAALGPPAFPFLREGLSSGDHQRRQLCGQLLREGYAFPTPDLIRVSVEGLANDGLSQRDFWANASSSARFLVKVVDRALPQLRAGMDSEDGQQRFLCAVVVGFARESRLAAIAAPILTEHMADNDVGEDAGLAAAALFALGDPARPYLERAMAEGDAQARDLARLVLLDLSGPPGSPEAWEERRRLNRVTSRAYSPTSSYGIWDVGSVQFPPAWKPPLRRGAGGDVR